MTKVDENRGVKEREMQYIIMSLGEECDEDRTAACDKLLL
jgi:hypothetical protein